MEKKIKKIDPVYLILYLLVPVAVIAVCYTVMAVTGVIGNTAVALGFGPVIFAALWWILGGKVLYNNRKKAFEKNLTDTGFVRNHTFYGDGCTVVVDTVHRKLALLFRWNPMQSYVIPVGRIERAWVDDGRGGAGFLEGSSRVSFLFSVDGVNIRVNTFTSNKRWRMDSDHILTGISKADLMVEVLNEARNQVN